MDRKIYDVFLKVGESESYEGYAWASSPDEAIERVVGATGADAFWYVAR